MYCVCHVGINSPSLDDDGRLAVGRGVADEPPSAHEGGGASTPLSQVHHLPAAQGSRGRRLSHTHDTLQAPSCTGSGGGLSCGCPGRRRQGCGCLCVPLPGEGHGLHMRRLCRFSVRGGWSAWCSLAAVWHGLLTGRCCCRWRRRRAAVRFRRGDSAATGILATSLPSRSILLCSGGRSNGCRSALEVN